MVTNEVFLPAIFGNEVRFNLYSRRTESQIGDQLVQGH